MRHYIIKLFIPGAFLFLGMATNIFANGGNLDTGFNVTGKSIFNIESAPASGSFADIVVISGNKFLVAGRVEISSQYYAVTLNRFNSDGSPDTTFGSGGNVITDTGVTSEGTGLAVQSDGKIIVIGIAEDYSNRKVAVLRYTPDGMLDTTFGTNGIFFSVLKVAKDVKILADDKILIAGASNVPNAGFTQVTKLNANGSLDTTFGDNGIASSTSSSGSATDKMAIQSNGKIVISGSNFYSEGLVHRFNADGSPDATFGTGGIRQITGPGNTTMYMSGGVAIQPDGKIVLAGSALPSIVSNTQLVLIRLNADGSNDNSFGTQFGMIFHDLSGSSDSASDTVLQSDGKIVVSGIRSGGAMVARFDSLGALDPAFGSGGVNSLPPGNNADDIALQGSNIVTVGYDFSGMFVSRVDQAGATLVYRNENFNVGKNDVARDVAVQADGKIVTVGFSIKSNGDTVFSAARQLSNGSLDPSFGTGGKFASNEASEAYSVKIQPDGKIVIAGRWSPYISLSNYYYLFVTRLNTNGTLDTTFGTNGKTVFQGAAESIAYDMEFQPDGKIVIGGTARRWVGDGIVDYDFTAARLNPNGTTDTGFGNNGLFILPTGDAKNRQFEKAYTLTVLADGKIVLAGTHMLRLNPNGTVDAIFSSEPIPLTFTASDIKLQPDGKMILSASTYSDFTLIRLNSNASFDTSFGVNGIATLDFGGSDGANAIYLETNGNILAGGFTFGGNPSRRKFALARFKPNGSPDPGFGSGGKVITDLGGDAQIFGLTRQSDGKIVAAGEAKVTNDRDYALARYLPQSSPFDFDGDGKTDISIFRPSVGEWWILKSSNGGNMAFQFGNSADKLAPADFTGDGKADVAIFRPSSGEWFILRSEDQSYYSFSFGMAGDIPAPGDFDGDGKADPAVFRPSNATWYISRSSGGTTIEQFGVNGDIPVVSDYDADGVVDIAIYRPSNGQWWINRSNLGIIAFTFGTGADKPVQGDYTGDAKADVAVWRPSSGEWFILRSENQSYYSFAFGLSSDIPAPGDYDGDGKFDATVFRPSGSTWYSLRSSAGTLIENFGITGDLPVPGAFVP